MKEPAVFVDANIFLRYLTNDLPEKALQIERVFRDASRGKVKLVTNVMVMAEIVWVLESYYKCPKEKIGEMILKIVNTGGIVVEDSDIIIEAIEHYVSKNIDFLDAYNAEWMKSRNTKKILTLDVKHFSKITDVEILTLEGKHESKR